MSEQSARNRIRLHLTSTPLASLAPKLPGPIIAVRCCAVARSRNGEGRENNGRKKTKAATQTDSVAEICADAKTASVLHHAGTGPINLANFRQQNGCRTIRCRYEGQRSQGGGSYHCRESVDPDECYLRFFDRRGLARRGTTRHTRSAPWRNHSGSSVRWISTSAKPRGAESRSKLG